MLKIDPQQGRLTPFVQPALGPGRLAGRRRLDDLVVAGPEAFFSELGRPMFLLGRLTDFDPAADRSNLLAADESGRLFVVAVQDENGVTPDLVEALQTAEAVSAWAGPDILACLAPEAAAAARERLPGGPESLNSEQGVVLLAEFLDVDTLATSRWLAERYGVHADCGRVSLFVDAHSGEEYLTVERLGAVAEASPADLDPAAWPDVIPDVSDAPPEVREPTPDVQTSDEPVGDATEAPSTPDWEAEFQAAIDSPPPTPSRPSAPEPKPEAEAEAKEASVAEPNTETGSEAVQAQAEPAASEPLEFLPGVELDDDFEDPLAEVIEAREQAEAAASEPHEPGAERREAERSESYQARRLRLNYFGRLLGARLVDFSDKGIGVEALSPLPVGAEIGVSGELVSDEKVVALEGRARVRHSKPNEDGVCRIGFSIDPNAIKELDTPEAFERR